jgi:nucleotide-binding universal stress UspA family protein
MKRILVAFDGHESSQYALEQGAELARAFNAEIGVVSVTPWSGGRGGGDPWDDREAHATALRSARDWLAERGFRPDLYAPSGDPAESVTEVAGRQGFDTIVVGTRGLGPVGRFLQRSVSAQLATDAGVTVVVARQPRPVATDGACRTRDPSTSPVDVRRDELDQHRAGDVHEGRRPRADHQ